jgi:hypothetical protein
MREPRNRRPRAPPPQAALCLGRPGHEKRARWSPGASPLPLDRPRRLRCDDMDRMNETVHGAAFRTSDAIFKRPDTGIYDPAARGARVVHEVRPSKDRGRRESRMRAAPAVSCAKQTWQCAHEHTGSAEAFRPSLRNGFTAYFVLSPANGCFATVAAQILLRDLTPAPRRQDHTTSPSASRAFVLRIPRPPHLTATFVTISSRPSSAVRRAEKEH